MDVRGSRVVFLAWLIFLPSSAAFLDQVPHSTPAAVPNNAGTEGGYGTATWHLHVVDLEGHPIPGAAVSAYWPVLIKGPNGPMHGRDAIDEALGGIQHLASMVAGGELHYVQLRTDTFGIVTIHAPHNYPVTFLATREDKSTEWLLRESSSGTEPRIALYPRNVVVSWNSTFAPVGSFSLLPNCSLEQLQLDPKNGKEMLERLGLLAVRISWTNGPPSAVADWEVGMNVTNPLDFGSAGPACPRATNSTGQHLSLGSQMEKRVYMQEELGTSATALFPNMEVYIGPVNHAPPSGVGTPYAITVNATLSGPASRLNGANQEFPRLSAVPATPEAGDDPVGVFGPATFQSGERNTSALGAPLLLTVVFLVLARRRLRDS